MNALPHFITEIDGLDIHFIHVRSKHENALPMIITHGWPGSIIEQLKIIEPLTNPTAHGGSRSGRIRCRDSVAAGLRLLGQADGDRAGIPSRIAQGVGDADAAPRLHEVRGAGRRLGQCRLRDDGAAAAAGVARHSHQHAGDRPARYLQGARRAAARRRPVSRPTRKTRGISSTYFYKNGLGYANEMATRPQTLYGIVDSPVGLAAWMLDHDARSYELIARVFDGKPEGLTRDDILDNITLYWLTNTAISSARLYWDTQQTCRRRLLRRQGRQDPGRRERLSRRDLLRRRRAGRRRRIRS